MEPNKIDKRLMRQAAEGKEKRVSVVLQLNSDGKDRVEEIFTLKQLGVLIDAESKRVVTGSIPETSLVKLGELPFVQSVQRPKRFRLL